MLQHPTHILPSGEFQSTKGLLQTLTLLLSILFDFFFFNIYHCNISIRICFSRIPYYDVLQISLLPSILLKKNILMAHGLTVFQDNKQEIWVPKKPRTPSPSDAWMGELHLTKTCTRQETRRLARQQDSWLHPFILQLKRYRNPVLSFSSSSSNCNGNSSP